MGIKRDHSLFAPAKPPSHRQLRMGEEVRHILSALLLRTKFSETELPTSITVTQVQMSPDLQNATVYVMPLGGQYREEVIKHLKEVTNQLRYQLGKELQSKFTPALRFRLDDSFDQAQRIEQLLKDTKQS